MELTQSDYDERKARVAAGNGTDEDLRLVKHYEDQGFSAQPVDEPKADDVARPTYAEVDETDAKPAGRKPRNS